MDDEDDMLPRVFPPGVPLSIAVGGPDDLALPPTEAPTFPNRGFRRLDDGDTCPKKPMHRTESMMVEHEVSERSIGPNKNFAQLRGQVRDRRISLGSSNSNQSFCDVSWQWLHKLGDDGDGWEDYDLATSTRIENAYRNGESKIRVRSGKHGDTPMVVFFHDMIQFDPRTMNTRPVRRYGAHSFQIRFGRMWKEIANAWSQGRMMPKRERFDEFFSRRQALLQDDVWTRAYDVTDYYYETGICSTVARSYPFFAVSMLGVLLNAFWIAVEVDHNKASNLADADVGFQIVEHGFCVFFVIELLVRFCAFERKSNCVKDSWFRFDLALVCLMVLEIWFAPLILFMIGASSDRAEGLGNLSVLRIARLLRLTRMTRLLRAVPELMTLLKGIADAVRSVVFTLLLLGVLLYVFGIMFKMQAEVSEELADQYFSTVGHSIATLLMHGTLLDSVSTVWYAIKDKANVELAILFLVFIFLSSFTLLNMLIGILCEVVSDVSRKEKEQAEIEYLKGTLLDLMECYDKNDNCELQREEFVLLMRNPDVAETLRRFGTDKKALISLVDMLLEERLVAMTRTPSESMDSSALIEPSVSFSEFLALVMRLKGEHAASVTDIVDLREYNRKSIETLERKINEQLSRLSPEVLRVCGCDGTTKLMVVNVHVDGQVRKRQHAPSTRVGELIDQVCLDPDRKLIARSPSGLELGSELTLAEIGAGDDTVHVDLILPP